MQPEQVPSCQALIYDLDVLISSIGATGLFDKAPSTPPRSGRATLYDLTYGDMDDDAEDMAVSFGSIPSFPELWDLDPAIPWECAPALVPAVGTLASAAWAIELVMQSGPADDFFDSGCGSVDVDPDKLECLAVPAVRGQQYMVHDCFLALVGFRAFQLSAAAATFVKQISDDSAQALGRAARQCSLQVWRDAVNGYFAGKKQKKKHDFAIINALGITRDQARGATAVASNEKVCALADDLGITRDRALRVATAMASGDATMVRQCVVDQFLAQCAQDVIASSSKSYGLSISDEFDSASAAELVSTALMPDHG